MSIFKFDLLPSLLILIIILIFAAFTAVSAGKWQFNKQIDAELEKLKENNSKISDDQVIRTEDLQHLPSPVKKWLKKVGITGKNKIEAVHLKQSGLMKLEADQKEWFKPEAKQYIAVNKPGFLWQVDLPMLPLINTKGKDLFYQGKASMNIKIASLLPVVNQEANDKINESALHRFLLELPWYPTAALNDYLDWQEIDSTTAKATIDYKGVKASADFIFDQEGNLIRTEAMRYRESDEKSERMKCTGELSGYQTVDGIKIPTEIDVNWYLPEGKFTWFKVKVDEIGFEY